jgi:hypothetical protein
MNKYVSIFALTASLSLATAPVFADVITTQFSGVIVDKFGPVPSELSGIFAVGDSFSGRYTYSTSLAAYQLQPDTNWYNGVTDFSLTVGQYTWTTNQAWAEVSNGNGGNDAFGINVGSYPNSTFDLDGPVINGFSLWAPQLQFFDTRGTALSSTELPKSLVNLNDFTGNYETLTFRNSSNTRIITFWGQVLNLSGTISPEPIGLVPEPCSLALFGISFACLFLRRRGRP